jgi:periplasmic protein TonB
MFSNKRYAAVAASLLLCLSAGRAMAADLSAKIDTGDCEKPEYPVSWQEPGDGRDVTVAYLVGADGKVLESKLVSSSGSSRLDRASVNSGARCKFKPGAKDGQLATTWAKVRYKWIVD